MSTRDGVNLGGVREVESITISLCEELSFVAAADLAASVSIEKGIEFGTDIAEIFFSGCGFRLISLVARSSS